MARVLGKPVHGVADVGRRQLCSGQVGGAADQVGLSHGDPVFDRQEGRREVGGDPGIGECLANVRSSPVEGESGQFGGSGESEEGDRVGPEIAVTRTGHGGPPGVRVLPRRCTWETAKRQEVSKSTAAVGCPTWPPTTTRPQLGSTWSTTCTATGCQTRTDGWKTPPPLTPRRGAEPKTPSCGPSSTPGRGREGLRHR